MVPAASHRIPRVPWYLRTPLRGQSAFAYRAVTAYGCPFQGPSASAGFVTLSPSGRTACGSCYPRVATAAAYCATRVLAVPRSLATTEGMVSLPRPTKMFQLGRCPLPGLWIQPGVPGVCPGGLPHSGILGLTFALNYPRLIAEYCALRRLLVPRHPPCALRSLTYLSSLLNAR